VRANRRPTPKFSRVNGGLSEGILEANIDFCVESGVLKPGLTPAMVADLSHLHAVLDEIGRR
jgi:hypothetical protein